MGAPTSCRGGPPRLRFVAAGGAVAALALALALGGCDEGAYPAASSSTGITTLRPAWSEVRLVQRREVGAVLVDANGYTLYLFVPDHRGAPTCRDLCLTEWPPLTVPKGAAPPVAGPGVGRTLLGTVALADGIRQVTYNRWPLYLWVGDTAPGQVNGEAVTNFGGPWYAVDAAGDAVRVRTSL